MIENRSIFGDVFAENAPIIKNYYDTVQYDPQCQQIDAALNAYKRIYNSAVENDLNPDMLETVNQLAADILTRSITSQCIDESRVCHMCTPASIVNTNLKCKCPIVKTSVPVAKPRKINVPQVPTVRMRTEYKLILPKFDNELHRINTDALKNIAKLMATHFGGVTVLPKVYGCYVDNKKLQCEENMQLSAIRLPMGDANPATVKQADEQFMKTIARDAGRKFGQQAILTSEVDQFSVNFESGEYKKTIDPKLWEKDVFKGLVAKPRKK